MTRAASALTAGDEGVPAARDCGVDGAAAGELELPLQPLSTIATASADAARDAAVRRAPRRRSDGMSSVTVSRHAVVTNQSSPPPWPELSSPSSWPESYEPEPELADGPELSSPAASSASSASFWS